MAQEFPKISDGYLGPQAKFGLYGLSTISHPEPLLELDTNFIEIEIGTTASTRFTTKLLNCTTKKDNNDYVLVQRRSDRMIFVLILPEIAYYKFQIYALPSNEAGHQMVGVFNYVLHPTQILREVVPFPKQYPQWREGGFLYEPLGLPKGFRGAGVRFKYFVPNASEVMIKVGEDWNPLTKYDNDIWEGVADITKNYARDTKVKLNVKYGGKNFNTLIEYTI